MAALTVIAKLKAKPGSEDALVDLQKGLVAPTRAERGCIAYDLHRSHDDPGLFMFTESWESRPLDIAGETSAVIARRMPKQSSRMPPEGLQTVVPHRRGPAGLLRPASRILAMTARHSPAVSRSGRTT